MSLSLFYEAFPTEMPVGPQAADDIIRYTSSIRRYMASHVVCEAGFNYNYLEQQTGLCKFSLISGFVVIVFQ